MGFADFVAGFHLGLRFKAENVTFGVNSTGAREGQLQNDDKASVFTSKFLRRIFARRRLKPLRKPMLLGYLRRMISPRIK